MITDPIEYIKSLDKPKGVITSSPATCSAAGTITNDGQYDCWICGYVAKQPDPHQAARALLDHLQKFHDGWQLEFLRAVAVSRVLRLNKRQNGPS